jgi:hypothetical protein
MKFKSGLKIIYKLSIKAFDVKFVVVFSVCLRKEQRLFGV